MRKFISILVFVNLSIITFGQTPADEVIDRMNYVFTHVNRSNISTGLLSNYGVQPIPFEYYNGIPADSNFVDINSYTLLYAGIYSSKLNNNITLITPDELLTRIQDYTSGTAIPVSVMHYAYNRIKETAVEEGLVDVVNEQIIEIAGKNPYETLNLFAAGPKEVITERGTVSFIFPSTLRMTNITKTVQNLQVRFDENLAFVTTTWNTVLSYNYTTEGVKKVHFKINYTDGTSFTSQTNMLIRVPHTGGTRGTGPGQINPVSIDPITNRHSGGTVQIRYATSNNTGKIKKALVIADPFDPSPLLDASNMNLGRILDKPEDYGFITDSIDMNNYDIVYVDNNNGIDDIRKNATLFEEAMDLINSPTYRNADAAPNIVMGISMGGLVARYALRKMEMQGKDHKTWKYISIDSPHKGANVPVGLQAALRHISSFDVSIGFIKLFRLSKQVPILEDALKVLNSPAAKQMLIYNVNYTGTGYDNSIHTAFLTEYEQMGFPQKCQNIAVSNGNIEGTQLFAPGSQLFEVNYRKSLSSYLEYVNIINILNPLYTLIPISNRPQLMLNIIPGKTSFGLYADIYGINTTANSIVYSGSLKLHKKILWLINSSVTLTSSSLRAQQDMYPIDGATGGIVNLDDYMDSIPDDFIPFIKQTKFSFIPRGSSLALNDWNTNYTANLQGVDLFSTGKTEFEYVSMSPTIAEPHVTFDASKQFIINQLKEKPISPNTFQSVFCGNQNITLSNPQRIPLTWSVTDNMFKILSPTNTSATITSAPTVRSAILTIGSTNTYSLRKRLVSSCNLSISISTKTCDQATFTIQNFPLTGATAQWSSNNSTVISGQNTGSATFQKFRDGTDQIKATVTYNNQAIVLTPLSVYFGAPVITNITGPQRVTNGEYASYRATVDPNGPVPTRYEWILNPQNGNNIYGNGTYQIDIAFYNPGNYQLVCRAISSCGTGEYYVMGLGVYNPANPYSEFSLSPNPATDVITIQLEEETPDNGTVTTQRKALSSSVTEIQLWSATSLIRTYKTDQSTYQISVSDLAAGMYFVRVIKDGKIYTKKLIKN